MKELTAYQKALGALATRIETAISEGALRLEKTKNISKNVGKSPSYVLAEQLLGPEPFVPQPETAENS